MQPDYIVSSPSVDGILTTAALLRSCIRSDEVGVRFVCAPPNDGAAVADSMSLKGARVVLVDCLRPGPFLQRLRAAGGVVEAVFDGFAPIYWHSYMNQEELDALAVRPWVSAGSAAAVLRQAFRTVAFFGQEHIRRPSATTLEMLNQADAYTCTGDLKGDFAVTAHKALWTAKEDTQYRAIRVARRFGAWSDPDDRITGWIEEHDRENAGVR